MNNPEKVCTGVLLAFVRTFTHIVKLLC